MKYSVLLLFFCLSVSTGYGDGDPLILYNSSAVTNQDKSSAAAKMSSFHHDKETQLREQAQAEKDPGKQEQLKKEADKERLMAEEELAQALADQLAKNLNADTANKLGGGQSSGGGKESSPMMPPPGGQQQQQPQDKKKDDNGDSKSQEPVINANFQLPKTPEILSNIANSESPYQDILPQLTKYKYVPAK